jgi:hypothetical protein
VGHPPSGIRGTGPLIGPPELNRFLFGCGLGDADALLEGDVLLLGEALLVDDGLEVVEGVGLLVVVGEGLLVLVVLP